MKTGLRAKDRVELILERIAASAARSGRHSEDVQLLAVTKMRPIPSLQELYDLGLRQFGENRVAEAKEKQAVLPNDISWHMIGSLQSNKTSQCTGFTMVHSLDRLSVAAGLEKAWGLRSKVLDVLLEIKTSDESTKSGIETWYQACALIDAVAAMPHLRLKGLMTMAPFSPLESTVRPCFSALRGWQTRLQSHFSAIDWGVLSMGMSNDFEWAIAEGSTLVRIGTALFQS